LLAVLPVVLLLALFQSFLEPLLLHPLVMCVLALVLLVPVLVLMCVYLVVPLLQQKVLAEHSLLLAEVVPLAATSSYRVAPVPTALVVLWRLPQVIQQHLVQQYRYPQELAPRVAQLVFLQAQALPDLVVMSRWPLALGHLAGVFR
jgi:hypothetical protein